MDNAVVANIQTAIVNHFGAVDELPLLSVGFTIAGLATAMPLSKLYTMFDRKWLSFFFAVNVMAASVLCGAAPNMGAEIMGRAWAGVGLTGMYHGLLTLVTARVPERRRHEYLTLASLAWGLGTILGPVVGGALELYSWCSAFYISVFLGIPLLPAYVFLVPSTHPAPRVPAWRKLSSLDFVGILLSVSSLAAFTAATNLGGVLLSWKGRTLIILYAVSAILAVGFNFQQAYYIFSSPRHRLLPVHLLRSREVSLLFVLMACGAAMASVALHYVPLYFQLLGGDSAIKTAQRILALVFLVAFGMLASGCFIARVGYYKPCYVVGSLLGLSGAVLMSLVGIDTPNAAVYGYEALLAFGSGFFVHAGFAAVQANVHPKETTRAVSLMVFG